jgi:hypothetical protein
MCGTLHLEHGKRAYAGAAEIFLHLLGRYAGSSTAGFRGVPADLAVSAATADGDGMAPGCVQCRRKSTGTVQAPPKRLHAVSLCAFRVVRSADLSFTVNITGSVNMHRVSICV